MKDEFGDTAGFAGMAVTTPATSATPTVTLDVALYERYLTESGMTEEQKREFLELLWTIIVGFVDLGFGIDPVQQAEDAAGCGRNDENDRQYDVDLISSDGPAGPTNTTPNMRADIESAARKGRRS